MDTVISEILYAQLLAKYVTSSINYSVFYMWIMNLLKFLKFSRARDAKNCTIYFETMIKLKNKYYYVDSN